MLLPFWIFYVFVRTFVFSPFIVEGDSMLPTIQNGEVFLVDKLSYRTNEPQRDDIVVFYLKDAPKYFYVKRVIGLPGDSIHLAADGIYLVDPATRDRTKLNEPYVEPEKYLPQKFLSSDNTLGEDFTVPDGKYFLLGDNRLHSKDSRYFTDPFISLSQIVGKFGFILYVPS